eukprot:2180109-Pleurochrysis_carterae.AAC.1
MAHGGVGGEYEYNQYHAFGNMPYRKGLPEHPQQPGPRQPGRYDFCDAAENVPPQQPPNQPQCGYFQDGRQPAHRPEHAAY